jgi:hypothetical protein
MKIEASEELAYWVGVVQSDGCLNIYHDKKRNKIFYRISVDVGKKSFPMLKKFQNISNLILGCSIEIYKCKNDVFKCTLGAKRLLDNLKLLDIKISDSPIPPNWICDNENFIGNYLAGIIDGDGNVSIRKDQKKCVIEIFSHEKQILLQSLIKNRLKCGAWIRKASGNCYGIGFIISHKNYKFVKNCILPNVAIAHKKEALEECIMERFGI